MKRAWDPAYEQVSVPRLLEGGAWTIENVRDCSYAPNEVTKKLWRAITLNPKEVVGAWYYVATLQQFGPLRRFFAHTFMSFSFADGTRLGFSIEARRHEGEPYDPFVRGMFGMYELTYLWGTECDFEERRKIYQVQELERYPLTLSQTSLEKLVTAALKRTSESNEKNLHYHSIGAQCTNILIKILNEAVPKKVPWHPYWHLTGLSPHLLARNGLLDVSKKEIL